MILLLLAQLAVTAPATPAVESHPLLMHAALASTILAHAADLSTTAWAMGKASASGGRYYEANPIMRPFAEDPVTLALAKMGVAGAVNYGLFRMHDEHPRLTLALALTQTVVFGLLAHHNAQALGLR